MSELTWHEYPAGNKPGQEIILVSSLRDPRCEGNTVQAGWYSDYEGKFYDLKDVEIPYVNGWSELPEHIDRRISIG